MVNTNTFCKERFKRSKTPNWGFTAYYVPTSKENFDSKIKKAIFKTLQSYIDWLQEFTAMERMCPYPDLRGENPTRIREPWCGNDLPSPIGRSPGRGTQRGTKLLVASESNAAGNGRETGSGRGKGSGRGAEVNVGEKRKREESPGDLAEDERELQRIIKRMMAKATVHKVGIMLQQTVQALTGEQAPHYTSTQ